MKIYSFLEWADNNISKKCFCVVENKECNPSSTTERCVECYEDYVYTTIPKQYKEV